MLMENSIWRYSLDSITKSVPFPGFKLNGGELCKIYVSAFVKSNYLSSSG